MIRVDVLKAETQLARYVAEVEQGKTIVLCRNNIPVAEIRPLTRPPNQPRPVGIDRGMKVPSIFFEPLPEDLLAAFEGKQHTDT
ncbi:MAG: type II toxin-antitoxin system Phd/YefM family antitoxin [Deltaproteobacteria bacterium]|nr:type II toxin-antitoxin system Phd/YefM family antitoxin [Deltaproteobacteria bacterium]